MAPKTDSKTEKKPPLSITLKRLYSLAWPERWTLGLASVFLLLSAVGNLAFPRAVGTLLDDSITGLKMGKVDLDHVDQMALVLVAIFAATAVASAFRFLLFSRSGERIVSTLRGDLYASLMGQETGFFDTQKVGDLSSRLSSDTSVLQTTVSANLSMVLRNLTIAIGSLGMLIATSLALASAS